MPADSRAGGPIVGILLAAGRGRRFGSDKLLHPLPDGRPLALAAAVALQPAVDRLIAVLRPDSVGLAEMLAAQGVETLFCPDADAGMGHSLAAGVRASPEAAGWLVALADMPFIRPASHQAVAAQLRAGASLSAPGFEGRRGHPVGFGRRWYGALSELEGDQGARTILAGHQADLVLIPVDDPGVLHDIDRPEDLMPDR